MSIDDTRRFLHALDPTVDDEYTFQTFDDNAERRLPALAHTLHGTLDQHLDQLLDLNQRGAGVFVTVQSTDLTGRKNENVLRVRALFADDDTPRDGVRDDLPLLPHIITESSTGKYHYYWLVDGCPLEDFKGMQRAIATVLETDVAVNDLPRVMRLPGFLHRKGASFMSRVVDIHDWKPYTLEQLQREFAARLLDIPTVPRETAPPAVIEAGATVLADGERHEAYKQMAFTLRAKGLGANAIAAQLWDQDATNPISDGHTYIPSIANWTAQTFPPHYNGPKPDIAPAVDSIIDTMPAMNGHDTQASALVLDDSDDDELPEDLTLRTCVSNALQTMGKHSHNDPAVWALTLSDQAAADDYLASFRFEGPGAEIQDMLRDCRQTTTYRPVLGVTAVIITLAVALGRIYRSPTGVASNIILAALAPTGAGKQLPNTLIKDVFIRAGYADFIMSSKTKSTVAIEEHLGESPNSFSSSNEFGQDMQALLNLKNEGAKANGMAFMLDMFSEANNPNYLGAKAAGQLRTRNSRYPCLTIAGFSTIEPFVKVSSSDQVTSGFLPRVLVFNDAARFPHGVNPLERLGRHRAVNYDKPPQAAIEMVQRLRNISAHGQNLAGLNIDQLPIENLMRRFGWGIGAAELYDDLVSFKELVTEAQFRLLPPLWCSLISRAPEYVQKLAMCISASRTSGEGLEISREDLAQAIQIFLACCTTTHYLLDAHMADSEREAQIQKIKRIVAEAGGCIRLTDLKVKTRGMPDREYSEAIGHVVSYEGYRWRREITSRRGPKATYLIKNGAKVSFKHESIKN